MVGKTGRIHEGKGWCTEVTSEILMIDVRMNLVINAKNQDTMENVFV